MLESQRVLLLPRDSTAVESKLDEGRNRAAADASSAKLRFDLANHKVVGNTAAELEMSAADAKARLEEMKKKWCEGVRRGSQKPDSQGGADVRV